MDKWSTMLESLARLAVDEPQVALAILLKSAQHQWGFSQRVDSEGDYHKLTETLKSVLAAILGRTLGHPYRGLFTVPARLGGLGVKDPTSLTPNPHASSKEATKVLQRVIEGSSDWDRDQHQAQMTTINRQWRSENYPNQKAQLDTILSELPAGQVRAVQRAVDENTSSLLTAKNRPLTVTSTYATYRESSLPLPHI
eukprot:GHVN01052298.1.p2 GENE.GHVN01052298.1~~GHVN01052298.1.p2  ORF type:complete len:197 (+),score=17.33 GHVN01052298.1:591-1181(+)